MARVRCQREPSQDEAFRRADGQYRWHLQRGVPLRDEAGNIVMVWCPHDIEERKSAEGKIRDKKQSSVRFSTPCPNLFGIRAGSRRLYATAPLKVTSASLLDQ